MKCPQNWTLSNLNRREQGLGNVLKIDSVTT